MRPYGGAPGSSRPTKSLPLTREADSPCQGADSPYQGEMSRSDRGDREAVERSETKGVGACPRRGPMGTSAPTERISLPDSLIRLAALGIFP